MSLRVIGAGLPRTGTQSLATALEQLLGGPCYHMRTIPGHPFDLGPQWHAALRGEGPDWDAIYDGYAAAVDWPTAMFWRELSEHYPEAPVILSVRDSAETWWPSVDATIVPYARDPEILPAGSPNGLVELLQRFTGTESWDDRQLLMDCYNAHLAAVRDTIAAGRLVEWQPRRGWQPLCQALDLPVPDVAFPWLNQRSDWS